MRSSSLKNWTWQLFKTERFAATLFPAKRKTTWISHCSGSSNTQNLRETECTGTAPSQLHLPYYPHATPCSRWCIVVPPNSVAALCCLCLPLLLLSPHNPLHYYKMVPPGLYHIPRPMSHRIGVAPPPRGATSVSWTERFSLPSASSRRHGRCFPGL